MTNHTNCIIDEVEKLMNRGFDCYLEYNICQPTKKRSAGIFVDIFAQRGVEEIILEIGTCYHESEEYKFELPNTKIIFVNQLKNWGINGSTIWQLYITKLWEDEKKFLNGNLVIPSSFDELKEPWRTECIKKWLNEVRTKDDVRLVLSLRDKRICTEFSISKI